jgi:phage major head subunit gpT-like protein
MPAITPAYLTDLETNMRLISSRAYDGLSKNLWWTKIAKRMPSGAKKERINWLLDTARIERTISGGGQVNFEDIVSQTVEYENQNASAGLRLKKEQLEDLDGNGVQLATHWSRQVGAYAAYWPQKMVAEALLANGNSYDGVAFFATNHPLNPFDSALGTFRNLFTSTASGIYPGALDISEAVTVDVAVKNLAKAIAYIASIKMPNGVDPRFLRVASILVPPALTARAQQITNAKLIAQAATGGAGSADVEAIVRNFGLGQPVQVDEIGSASTGGSDTTWYLACEQITSDELGAFTYIEREPFSVVYHGPQTDADLAKMREFQWTTEGRNIVGTGHPFLLFKCSAT